MVSLLAGLKIEGIVKWRGLKSQGPLYNVLFSWQFGFVKFELEKKEKWDLSKEIYEWLEIHIMSGW